LDFVALGLELQAVHLGNCQIIFNNCYFSHSSKYYLFSQL
jgi:hypothetical protein